MTENKIEDATFSESVNKANLPADLKIFRHPLMEGQNRDYVKPIIDELELDAKLGLKTQYSLSQVKLVEKDIDELTKSNNYFEVTQRGLSKLFKITALARKCWLYNAVEYARPFVAPVGLTLFGLVLGVVLIRVGTINKNAISIVSGMGICMSSAALLLAYLHGKTFRVQKISVSLAMESVESTKIKIPRGAKLKLLEAKESKIFDKFLISYPDVRVETRELVVPRIRLQTDPAIVGQTVDKRIFMICWWDIKKDIDRAVDQINKLKHLKVE